MAQSQPFFGALALRPAAPESLAQAAGSNASSLRKHLPAPRFAPRSLAMGPVFRQTIGPRSASSHATSSCRIKKNKNQMIRNHSSKKLTAAMKQAIEHEFASIRTPIHQVLAPKGKLTVAGRRLLEKILCELEVGHSNHASLGESTLEDLIDSFCQCTLSESNGYQVSIQDTCLDCAPRPRIAVLLRTFFESFAGHFSEKRRLEAAALWDESRELRGLCLGILAKFFEKAERDLHEALWEYFVLKGWN